MRRQARDKTRPVAEAWPTWSRTPPYGDDYDEPPHAPAEPASARASQTDYAALLEDEPRRRGGLFRGMLLLCSGALLGMAGATALYLWQPAALESVAASARSASTLIARAINNQTASGENTTPVALTGSPAETTAQAAAPAASQQPPQAPVAILPPVPDAPTLMMLVRTTFAALHHAMVSGNFVVLRDLAGPSFREVNTPASLSASFGKLAGLDLDLSRVLVENPGLIREPWVDEGGRLRILGFFPTSGSQVNFELVFELVQGRWRLFGLGADEAERAPDAPAPQRPPPPVAGKVPDDATLAALIRSSVLALNQANATGNYSVLLDSGAPGFRQANNAARLAEAFAPLRERELDLSPVAVLEPKLFRPPSIDGKGYLRLTGFFPSQPEQVNFDLAYAFTTRGWQLFGIGLNTSREEPAAAAAASRMDDAFAPLPASVQATTQQAPASGMNAGAAGSPPAANASQAPGQLQSLEPQAVPANSPAGPQISPQASPMTRPMSPPVLPRLRPPFNASPPDAEGAPLQL